MGIQDGIQDRLIDLGLRNPTISMASALAVAQPNEVYPPISLAAVLNRVRVGG
jgi:hypothetical protein